MADVLVQHLKTIRSNFSAGLYAYCLLCRLKAEDVATGNRVIVGEDGLYCIPRHRDVPAEAGKYYEAQFGGSPDFNLKRAAMEFAKMLLRNFTLDSFEAIKRYCEEMDQVEKMRAEPWYQFTRIMRNSLTHTQRWNFNRYDLTRLPVTWRDKTVDASMDGHEPDFEFYDWWDGCELWEEMNEFARSLD